jgi:hypothetical protein
MTVPKHKISDDHSYQDDFLMNQNIYLYSIFFTLTILGTQTFTASK